MHLWYILCFQNLLSCPQSIKGYDKSTLDEVVEMDSIFQARGYIVPSREILEAISQRFSNTAERYGKVKFSAKQVWNWFQNMKYAIRAKETKTPVTEQVYVPPSPRDDQDFARNLPPTPQPQHVHSTTVKKYASSNSFCACSISLALELSMMSVH